MDEAGWIPELRASMAFCEVEGGEIRMPSLLPAEMSLFLISASI
jgi:hypothetical protein